MSRNGADSEMSDTEQDAVVVTHHFETEIDTDRVDEWVEANFPEGSVQVMELENRKVIYDSI